MVQLSTGNVKNLVAVFDFLPGRSFPVTYAEAEGEADPRTRTFAVVFNHAGCAPGYPDPPRHDGDDSRGRRPIATASRPNEWPIPSAAVFVDADGKRYVWRVDRGTQTVQRVAVTVGDVRGDQVVVRGGLGAGETIVTAGVNHLQEGEKIRLLPPEESQDPVNPAAIALRQQDLDPGLRGPHRRRRVPRLPGSLAPGGPGVHHQGRHGDHRVPRGHRAGGRGGSDRRRRDGGQGARPDQARASRRRVRDGRS